MRCLITLTLLGALAWPALAQDAPEPKLSVDEALGFLDEESPEKLGKALKVLAAGGDEARKALEAYLWPAGNKKAAPPLEMTAETKAKIEALIAQLDSRKYKEREAATRALVEMGKGVIPFVEKLLDSPKAEVVSRAKQILGALRPKPKVAQGKTTAHDRVHAALLLGQLGSYDSIKTLRRELETQKDPAVRAAAAAALRSITGGGPTPSPLDWDDQGKAAPLLASWQDYLAGPGAKPRQIGDHALALKYKAGMRLGAKGSTKLAISMRIDMGPNAPAGAPTGIKQTLTSEATYDVKLTQVGPQPSIARKYRKHVAKQAAEMAGGAMPAPPGGQEEKWTGKELVIRFDKAGQPQVLLDDAPLRRSRAVPAPGHLLALALPQGAYPGGKPRALDKQQLDRLTALLSLRESGGLAAGANRGQVHFRTATLRFLGSQKDGDHWMLDSWMLAGMNQGPQQMSLDMTLQGTIVVDPDRGVVRRYQLSGIYSMRMAQGGAAGITMTAVGSRSETLEDIPAGPEPKDKARQGDPDEKPAKKPDEKPAEKSPLEEDVPAE